MANPEDIKVGTRWTKIEATGNEFSFVITQIKGHKVWYGVIEGEETCNGEDAYHPFTTRLDISPWCRNLVPYKTKVIEREFEELLK